jgi:SpoIVB peptidase S55
MIRSMVVKVAAVALALSAAGTARATDIMPLDQIRPGMKGVGRTVFEGNKLTDFDVEIIGVLENIGPKQSMILARLVGGPLANTGVIAGMSGSPVYIDGKLVGAVAYGFPFSKETIAGITPFAEMVDFTAMDTPRAASTRFKPTMGPGGPAAPLDARSVAAALNRPLRPVALDSAAWRSGSMPNGLSGGSLTPLALPLVFSGFDPATFDWARGIFSAMGFAPLMGTGSSGSVPQPLPDLQAGGPVGISLVEGDLDLSVTGTITHIEGNKVYAFGHPFYNLGPTQFPMRKAYVYSVFPSLYQSWKISVPDGDPVGTIEQDRATAVAGTLGKKPRMIPVEIRLGTSRGQRRTFSFRIVEDELFSPVLAYVGLASVLQAHERNYGTASFHVDARVSLADGRRVRVEDLFTQEQPAVQAAGLVAAPLAFLMSNDFQRVTVEKLEVNVDSMETTQTAALQRAWIERSGPVRPGTVVPLKVQLRTYRGETRTEVIPVSIPASAPAGAYTVLIADGGTITSMEQREMRQPFVPKDLDQLIRAINGLRHSNHVYARLLRSDEGAIVGGEYMQSLPPSVLAVLGGSSESGNVIPLRTASLWDFDLPTDYAVSGSRLLTLTIER